MSYENTTSYQDNLAPHGFQLTQTQHQTLSQLLPQGFSIEPIPKTNKIASSKPQKKLFTNEGNIIVKNEEYIETHTSTRSHISEAPTPSSSYWDHAALPTKRTFNDHTRKKVQTYLEESFFDDTLAVTMRSPRAKKQAASSGDFKGCSNLLQQLKKHKCVGPFLYPVDVKGLGLIDYFDVIKEPMDLSTVGKKLKAGKYSSVFEFGEDVRKIWNNAFTYNMEGSEIYLMTSKMSAYFEKLFKEALIKEASKGQGDDRVASLERKIKELSDQLSQMRDDSVGKGQKANGSRSKVPKVSVKMAEEPLTTEEKKVLCDNIGRLPPDALKGVWEIVNKESLSAETNKEELVFDLDALSVKVSRELERYVKTKIGKAKQNKNKKEAQTIKSSLTVDFGGFEPFTEGYNHHLTPKINNKDLQNNQTINNKHHLEIPKRKDKEETADSISSDSSFISDSDSDTEDEKKHAVKPAANNSFVKKQELDNFQPGSYGSMLNSFVVK